MKGEQVGIDRLRLGRGHAVREALVGFQGPVLQQLGRQRPGGDVGYDLVVLAVHDQHRDGDPPEVGREIGLPEGHDAVVVRWMTASEAFAPGRL